MATQANYLTEQERISEELEKDLYHFRSGRFGKYHDSALDYHRQVLNDLIANFPESLFLRELYEEYEGLKYSWELELETIVS